MTTYDDRETIVIRCTYRHNEYCNHIFREKGNASWSVSEVNR
jgi:hypothetical protein